MVNDIHLTGSSYYNYLICKRKAWLMQHQISPEQSHDLLDLGRLNQDEHYKREEKELDGLGIKVDTIRRENNKLILGEIKKSSSGLEASKLQLAYYLQRLADEGIEAAGEVLVPKERKKYEVMLDKDTQEKLEQTKKEIHELLLEPRPPKAVWLSFCPNCAYAEFCWSGEL